MEEIQGYINLHTHQPGGVHLSLYNYIVRDGKEAIPAQAFSAGIHPWYIDEAAVQQELLKKISTEKNCRAIGEAGLDHEAATPLDLQESVFVFQCRLAAELHKPMVLHVVKAHFEVIRIMKENGIQKAVFHGYNNRYTILEKVLENGYWVSIGDALMNERSPAAALLSSIPAEKLFLETDDSRFSIEEIYTVAAKKRKVTVAELQQQIIDNYHQLFTK